MQNEEMRQKFIESVEAAYLDNPNFDWFEYAMEVLPNSYAKGYIEAKLEQLCNYTDDRNIIKISLLEWAKYDIWK